MASFSDTLATLGDADCSVCAWQYGEKSRKKALLIQVLALHDIYTSIHA